MRTPSFWQIAILILIIVVIFGAARLPSIARNVGESLKVFKKEVKELRDDDEPASGTGTAPTSGEAGTGTSASASAPREAGDQPTAGSPPKSS